MKIVHEWLNDLVDDGAGDLADVDETAALLTDLGFAVDEVLHVGATVSGVVTAKVIRTERHPDAAKVHRVFVETGDGVERHVWCGAFNMAAGDVVPLATPGTLMPDGRAIEPKPILGIASDGMLCSAHELGLGDDHTGILLLPSDTPLGVPYGDALGLRPMVVFDCDVNRNTPHCFGHLGVAGHVAGRIGAALRSPSTETLPTPGAPLRNAPVEIIDRAGCPRFTSTVMSGIVVTQSPQWIAERLTAAGMRPINNVVDASNFVMLELNQPNHAYDLDALAGGGFRIRSATEGETMVTLDGTTRALTAADVLICDAADQPIGVGGVMGGRDSEIDDSTTVIALEVAWFDPARIVATCGRLGLRTEASLRFDRGVDSNGMHLAAARFAALLRLTCPDLVVHDGMVDATTEHLPVPPTIVVRTSRVNLVLGTRLGASGVAALLAPLGFAVAATSDTTGVEVDTLLVTVPTWRHDCADEIDIIEEVGRQHGFSKVSKVLPMSTVHGRLSPMQVRRRRLRDVLLGAGLTEAMPNPFLGDRDLADAGLDGPTVRLVNSLVADEPVLRTSLRPGLLKAVAFNESHRRFDAALFEIGHVYPPSDGELPAEFEALGIVIAGSDAAAAMRAWREVSAAMGFGARVDQSTVPAGLHPTRSATLSLGKDAIGALGEVHPDVLDAFGITQRVAVLELNLSVLLSIEPKIATWKPTSRYPSSDVDFAFVVPDDVPADKVEKSVRQAAGTLAAGVTLFDVYRGPGLPEGSRSLAYRVRLQAPDRTLSEADLTAVREKIVGTTAKLGAVLRT
jgi:phenylalanyl-tRNA synthetase beta chain